MNRKPTLLLVVLIVVCLGHEASAQTDDPPVADDAVASTTADAPATAAEARGRARILHESMHGALQVMHRDFFREDEGLQIPSRSLEDVFSELARSHGVQLRWIAVDLKPMNIDHQPDTDFEKEAARVLKTGQPQYEQVTADQYQFAGRIRLSAVCLSCHASRRSDNDDRASGLVITMPLGAQPLTQEPESEPDSKVSTPN